MIISFWSEQTKLSKEANIGEAENSLKTQSKEANIGEAEHSMKATATMFLEHSGGAPLCVQ